MSSATKTLELLAYFSPTRPEIGLSQFCRLAKRDKATTYRHLQALENAGFVEQNRLTKHYRLGPALLQLAQTREITVPRKSGTEDALRHLADATGETTHVGVLSGTTLYALASCESPRHSTRVIIDIQTFPLHATASGLCALAFGPDGLIEVAKADLRRFTSHTVKTPQELEAAVQATRRTGFAQSAGSLEQDVYSLATPIYDQTGLYAGSVSVACVATRFTPDSAQTSKLHLMTASREISRNWGGGVPADLERTWQQAMSQSHELEPTA